MYLSYLDWELVLKTRRWVFFLMEKRPFEIWNVWRVGGGVLMRGEKSPGVMEQLLRDWVTRFWSVVSGNLVWGCFFFIVILWHLASVVLFVTLSNSFPRLRQQAHCVFWLLTSYPFNSSSLIIAFSTLYPVYIHRRHSPHWECPIYYYMRSTRQCPC